MGVDVKIMAEQINKINESLYQANIDLVDKNKKLENEMEKLKQRLEVEIDISNGMLEAIDKAIEVINKGLNINSDYVDYDYGTELLRQELLEILKGVSNNE